jgi:hypothetical protein
MLGPVVKARPCLLRFRWKRWTLPCQLPPAPRPSMLALSSHDWTDDDDDDDDDDSLNYSLTLVAFYVQDDDSFVVPLVFERSLVLGLIF